MRAEEYDRIVAAIASYKGQDYTAAHIVKDFPYVESAVLMSVWGQEVQKRVKRSYSHYSQPSKLSRIYNKYLAAVERGDEPGIIINMAQYYNFSPAMLAKLILEHYLLINAPPPPNDSIHGGYAAEVTYADTTCADTTVADTTTADISLYADNTAADFTFNSTFAAVVSKDKDDNSEDIIEDADMMTRQQRHDDEQELKLHKGAMLEDFSSFDVKGIQKQQSTEAKETKCQVNAKNIGNFFPAESSAPEASKTSRVDGYGRMTPVSELNEAGDEDPVNRLRMVESGNANPRGDYVPSVQATRRRNRSENEDISPIVECLNAFAVCDGEDKGVDRESEQQAVQDRSAAAVINYSSKPADAAQPHGHKGRLSKMFRDTSLIPDKILSFEVHMCLVRDDVYGPFADTIKHSVGHEYEVLLCRKLEELGIGYQTEDDLRVMGCDKTPDVRLHVPIGVDGRVVNWIESKASFGDRESHKAYLKEQFWSYWNRFGPGLVIYWFGFIDELDTLSDKGIMMRESFPADIVRLDPLAQQ